MGSIKALTPTRAPETISVQIAARRLGISTAMAYRSIAAGTFPVPHIKLGNRVLICRAPFERLLAEGNGAAKEVA